MIFLKFVTFIENQFFITQQLQFAFCIVLKLFYLDVHVNCESSSSS